MPTTGEKTRAILATGRIANLPTVCSNILAGFCLSYSLFSAPQHGAFAQANTILPLILLMFACGMIYVAGCMLGDAIDHSFDLKNRPNRPIPLGLLDANQIRFTSYLLFILALVTLCLISPITNSLKPLPQDGIAAIQIHEVLLPANNSGYLLRLLSQKKQSSCTCYDGLMSIPPRHPSNELCSQSPL